jgi:hypothetical protein
MVLLLPQELAAALDLIKAATEMDASGTSLDHTLPGDDNQSELSDIPEESQDNDGVLLLLSHLRPTPPVHDFEFSRA